MRIRSVLTTAMLSIFFFAYSQTPAKIPSLAKINAYEGYIKANEQRHMQEFIDFVSIPSISSLPDHKKDVLQTAQWLKNKLQAIGRNNAEVLPTEGHPVVFAEWNKAMSSTRKSTLNIF